MKKIITDEQKLCSGCGTCALVCPKHCISYRTDILGSLHAYVDSEACINCGVCSIVCPIQKSFDRRIVGQQAYAAYARDNKVRFSGSSGGVFETLSNWVISQKGRVFASKFNDDLKLQMYEAVSADEVKQLTKSKYLQSDVAFCFPTIRERVKQGVTVLVCATPCQIAALKGYLGKEANSTNLYLIDFFCHGVPSQKMFDKCIEYVEKQNNIRVVGYEFRSKIKDGATPHYYTLKYLKNGQVRKKTRLYLADPFYMGFQKYITLRDSCYHCPYGAGNHVGDITIGDFHGIDKYIRGINRFDGVSTVIINNDKGNTIWKSVCDTLMVHEIDLELLLKDRQIYSGCTIEPLNRKELLSDLNNLSFDQVVKKWFSSKHEWKRIIYYHLPSCVRRRVKDYMGL